MSLEKKKRVNVAVFFPQELTFNLDWTVIPKAVDKR